MEMQVGHAYRMVKDSDGNYIAVDEGIVRDGPDDDCDCDCCDHAAKGAD